MKNLKNKVVVITGAGGGIGRALALRFADEGCDLAISDINQSCLSETEKLLSDKNIKIYSQILDVSDKKAMVAYPEKVVKQLGGADIVINNAGVCEMATVEEHTIEDYEWLMGVNFWGVLYGSKFFIPYLRKQTETYIVNIASIFGLFPMPHLSSYCTAKFAVRGFSESLRHELHKTNIRVMTVFPGGVKTDFAKNGCFKSVPGDNCHEDFNEIFDKYSMSTVESTSEKIVRAIKKGKVRVLIGPDSILGNLAVKLMPVKYDIFVRFICSKL